MRAFSALLLIVVIAALCLLGYENNRVETLIAWRWSWEVPFPLVIACTYLLGMLTGWSLLAWGRRSWQRVTESHRA